jgi:hypothetical protein
MTTIAKNEQVEAPLKFRGTLISEKTEGFHIKWMANKPFDSHRPKMAQFNYYDGAAKEDVFVYVLNSDLSFEVASIGKQEYEVCFTGSIEFELTVKQMNVLSGRNFSIDYAIEFINEDGEFAEEPEDFEMTQNMNLIFQHIEQIQSS